MRFSHNNFERKKRYSYYHLSLNHCLFAEYDYIYSPYIYPLEQKYANELMSFSKAKIHLEYLKANEPNQNHTQAILR